MFKLWDNKKVDGVFPLKLVNEIKAILDKHPDKTYRGLDRAKLRKDFLKSGFKDIKNADKGAYNHFLLEKKDFVFKNFGAWSLSAPKLSVPTLVISYEEIREEDQVLGYEILAIQPLADTQSDEFKKRLKKVCFKTAALNPNEYFGQDVSHLNLGLYKGEIVCFDW